VPANLTPDYLAAEARFKAERDPKKRIEALEEMLGIIPKHKGTEHLRGDLKKKLSQLREEIGGGTKKGGARRVSPGNIPAQGAGQVVLLGPTNTGKSALVRTLTRAEPEVAAYPYTTRKPLPGMMMYQDASIQLVDAPALDKAIYEPWMNTLVRNADLGLVVLDPDAPGVLEAMDDMQEVLASGRLKLTAAWWAFGKGEAARVGGDEDIAGKELDDAELFARLEPGDAELPVIVAVNRIDIGDNREQFKVLQELFEKHWPLTAVSAQTGEGLDRLREAVFRGLKVIRIYTKEPGKPPSNKEPFILPQGSTVRDMARHIHKDLEAKLRFARIWSERYHDGQRIPRDAELRDRDIVELNA
jgi:ribosome-interacting GTPase 1